VDLGNHGSHIGIPLVISFVNAGSHAIRSVAIGVGKMEIRVGVVV
jgi:hypothetical protein